MSDEDFEQFMSEQINQIRSFRQELEDELGREVEIDEAARRWIKQYAERFRRTYNTEKQAS